MPSTVSVNHPQDAPAPEREQVEMVTADVDAFENSLGVDFRDRCNRWYTQYRAFRRWSDQRSQAKESDRDTYENDAQNAWGAQLHIPLTFRTIETMVPRAIAQAPHLLYLPSEERWADNVDSVRMLIDAQQQNIDIDLPLQAVMRAGHMYGIGIGKAFWRQEWTTRRAMVPKRFSRGGYMLDKPRRVLEFDDPDFEDVDPYDFMWDPMGSAMRGSGRARWVVHRQWLGLAACLDRLASGAWNTDTARSLATDPRVEDRLRSMGNGQKYDEVWRTRMEVSGLSSSTALGNRGEQPHEVWEWHDGERVLTVLDRQILVQDAESPCCGMLPFQVYRPTPLQRQMVGIGDPETLEHLQRELDTLRSQRRDTATMALKRGYFYDDSAIDLEDFVTGPDALVPVRNAGDISKVMMPMPIAEVPGSALADEQVIKADIDAVSGLSDQVDSGGTAANTTATGAQLAQATLGMRIMLKSRRFEIEVVRNVARAFLRMDQRMITEQRPALRQPNPGYDLAQAETDPGYDVSRWKWFPIDPGALQGEFEIRPEGGSMAARNIPQDRQDMQMVMNLFATSPYVDPRRPLMYAFKKLGLDHTEAQSWLKQGEKPIPPAALKMLADAGVPQDWIDYAVSESQRQDPQLPDEEEQGAPDGA